MYALRSWLEIKGQIALMNTTYDVPFVGIYPEIYHGNDMGATTVVRYILNTPGVMAGYGIPGPTTFDKTDKIYVFSKLYDTFGVDDNHLMFLPVINLYVFKDLHQKRTKTCYLVGKGVNTNEHPRDSVELTRMFANNQGALAELLNECHTFYCYDPVSAMMDIARLCGCQVRYLGGKTRAELKKYEPGIEGLDFGYGTTFSSRAFRDRYLQMRKDFEVKLEKFIEDTQHD